MDEVDSWLQLSPAGEGEQGRSAALIRGMAAGIVKAGRCTWAASDIYTVSNVLRGSGLSSPRLLLRLLLVAVLNGEYNEGTLLRVRHRKDQPVCGKCLFWQTQRPDGPDGLQRGQRALPLIFKDHSRPRSGKGGFRPCEARLLCCALPIQRAATQTLTRRICGRPPARWKQWRHYFGKKVLREVDEAAF